MKSSQPEATALAVVSTEDIPIKFGSLSTVEGISAFVIGTVMALLVVWAKVSRTRMGTSEDSAKTSFLKDVLAELKTTKEEAHCTRQKWNEEAVKVARMTAEMSAMAANMKELADEKLVLAEEKIELIEENREIKHANQNLKQDLLLYAPPEVHTRIMNSKYGMYKNEDQN